MLLVLARTVFPSTTVFVLDGVDLFSSAAVRMIYRYRTYHQRYPITTRISHDINARAIVIECQCKLLIRSTPVQLLLHHIQKQSAIRLVAFNGGESGSRNDKIRLLLLLYPPGIEQVMTTVSKCPQQKPPNINGVRPSVVLTSRECPSRNASRSRSKCPSTAAATGL